MAQGVPFMKPWSLLFAVLFILASSGQLQAAPAVSDPAFQKLIAADHKTFVILRSNLVKATDFVRSRSDLFNPPGEQKNAQMSREDKLAIWNTWSSVLNC